MFLWFNFWGRAIESPYVDEIVENAKAMTYKHKYHKDVVRAEILGVDLTKEEWEYHIRNFIEVPFFLLMFSPFIFQLIRIGKKIKISISQISLRKKLGYLAVVAGPMTILPLYIMKVDFGRWTYAVIFYFLVISMALLMMKDTIYTFSIGEVYSEMLMYGKWLPAFLVLYGFLFTPFTDLSIDAISYSFYSLWGLES